jgi:Zinc finger, C3HC4 type (RING finger)
LAQLVANFQCLFCSVDIAGMKKLKSTIKTIEAKKKTKLKKGYVDKQWVKVHFPLRRVGNLDEEAAPRTVTRKKRRVSATAASGAKVAKSHGNDGQSKERVCNTTEQQELSPARPDTPEGEPTGMEMDEADATNLMNRNAAPEEVAAAEPEAVIDLPDPAIPHRESTAAGQPEQSPARPDTPDGEPTGMEMDEADATNLMNRNAAPEEVAAAEPEAVIDLPDPAIPHRESTAAGQPEQSPARPDTPDGEPTGMEMDEADATNLMNRNAAPEEVAAAEPEAEVLTEDRNPADHTAEDDSIEVHVEEINRSGELMDAEIEVIYLDEDSNDVNVIEREPEVRVHVPDPLDEHDMEIAAALRYQERFMDELQRQQFRRDLQHERNLDYIRAQRLRPIAPPHFFPAHGSPAATIITLNPTHPAVVTPNATVNVVLVPLMSAAEKEKAAIEDAKYAEELERQIAAGNFEFAREPEPSPFADRVCCICLTKPAIIAVVGCGHMCLCGTCSLVVFAKKHANCPTCRTGLHDSNGKLLLQRLY